jgi:hypothetical protein
MNVVIPASASNQPVITAPASCNNLIIETDADLIIANNSTLTVSGEVMIKGNQTNAGSVSNMRNINKNNE